MTTTVLAYNFQFARRVYPMSTRCLLAILLYSCNPSPKPGSPKVDTALTQKENESVAQRDSTVSVSAQPVDAHASTQHSEPLLTPQAILDTKLNNPTAVLTPN